MIRSLLALGALALVAVPASALAAKRTQPKQGILTCSNAAGDRGTVFSTNATGKAGTLSHNTIQGLIPLAHLKCAPTGNRPITDRMAVTTICDGRSIDNKSTFQVRISSGGFFFHQNADFITNNNVQPFAEDVPCTTTFSE